MLYAWPCIAFPLLQIEHLYVLCDILSPKADLGTTFPYFPKETKLPELEDTEYFPRTHNDSPTESGSESLDSSSPGSKSSDESRQEDSDVDSMPSSSEEEEEEEEEEEGNDVEVVRPYELPRSLDAYVGPPIGHVDLWAKCV